MFLIFRCLSQTVDCRTHVTIASKSAILYIKLAPNKVSKTPSVILSLECQDLTQVCELTGRAQITDLSVHKEIVLNFRYFKSLIDKQYAHNNMKILKQ